MHIQILEPAKPDHALQGWRLSRDSTATYAPLQVLNVDAPVNELPSALLNFVGFTILEREIFLSLRGHVAWARTSRVDDPMEFSVPETLAQYVDDSRIRAQMRADRAGGASQDQWRLHLPVLAQTAWTARMDVRTLQRLAKYFVYLIGAVPRELQGRCLSVADELEDVLKAMGFTPQDDWPLVHYLNERPLVPIAQPVTRVGACTHMSVLVPLALRAQLVRHRELMFIDDLFSRMTQATIMGASLYMPVRMQLMATDAVWYSILAKRNCWIAQADLWQDVLTTFNMPDLLPCADGACPYPTDNVQRIEGKDPNAVCPIYCELNKVEKAPYVAHMRRTAEHKPAWWQEHITEEAHHG